MPAVTPVPAGSPVPSSDAPAIVFDRVSFAFDDHVVLRDISFTLPRGSMTILLGASGSGKSVLLKLVLGLLRPDSGTITVNGHRIDAMPERALLGVRGDIGMLFQETALFDSMTVADNVGYRLYEETDMPEQDASLRVAEVLGFVGLGEYGDRMPSELSGGQKRRVAIARAMASRPSLLLFDDPTTGLDPVIASTVNDEVVKLRDLEHVSAIVATHQIRDAYYVANHRAEREGGQVRILDSSTEGARFMVLHDSRVYYEGTGADLLASPDAYLKEFLHKTLPPW
ncbi:MAG: ABC transporter ATP-binding protein [Vicinamibacterales bacterium]